MCYQKRIYGMMYEFYGFEGVEKYLPNPGGEIAALNPALDSWFHYFQHPAVDRQVEKVLVVNPYDESAEKIVTDRKNESEKWVLNKMKENRNSTPILGLQANNIILIDYEKVIDKAKTMGNEVFFSILMHETTHLLEQYLAEDCGIYGKLESEKREAYREAVLIYEEGVELDYLNETTKYQKDKENKGLEELTSLVEALTYYHHKAPNSRIVGELQQKLHKAIEIAKNGRGIPTE